MCVLPPGVLHWCGSRISMMAFIQFSTMVLLKPTPPPPTSSLRAQKTTHLCYQTQATVTQKPTWPIQSGQSACRDQAWDSYKAAVEYDLEEIDREPTFKHPFKKLWSVGHPSLPFMQQLLSKEGLLLKLSLVLFCWKSDV